MYIFKVFFSLIVAFTFCSWSDEVPEHRNSCYLNKFVSLYIAPNIGRALYVTFLTHPYIYIYIYILIWISVMNTLYVRCQRKDYVLDIVAARAGVRINKDNSVGEDAFPRRNISNAE